MPGTDGISSVISGFTLDLFVSLFRLARVENGMLPRAASEKRSSPSFTV
jgi:hypothetical protein